MNLPAINSASMDSGQFAPAQTLLQDVVKRIVLDAIDADVRVVFESHLKSSQFRRHDGLIDVQQLFKASHRSARPVPILVLGPDRAAAVKRSPELKLLLDWPGATYLPYGFSEPELLATVRQISTAATQIPLPAIESASGESSMNADAALRVMSEVRHWLENRLRNTEGALVDFERAARSELQLHRAYLKPAAAITREHREMLSRLWAADPFYRTTERCPDGLELLKLEIAGFQEAWAILETARTALRTTDSPYPRQALNDAVAALARVRDSLTSAVKLTLDFSAAFRAAGES